jgi:hypothetical protein
LYLNKLIRPHPHHPKAFLQKQIQFLGFAPFGFYSFPGSLLENPASALKKNAFSLKQIADVALICPV